LEYIFLYRLFLNSALSSRRFRESDQLPGNVRQKLEALPAVMLKLETCQASGKGQWKVSQPETVETPGWEKKHWSRHCCSSTQS